MGLSALKQHVRSLDFKPSQKTGFQGKKRMTTPMMSAQKKLMDTITALVHEKNDYQVTSIHFMGHLWEKCFKKAVLLVRFKSSHKTGF